MPQIRFWPGLCPGPRWGAHDTPPGCENEAKIKRLYEGKTATLGLHQMGNEMKKVGNSCSRMLCSCSNAIDHYLVLVHHRSFHKAGTTGTAGTLALGRTACKCWMPTAELRVCSRAQRVFGSIIPENCANLKCFRVQ